MMTPHGLQPGGTFGGVPKLTAQDVAGAMGMGKLPRHEASFLLVKYCQDPGPASELWSAWFMTVMERSRAQGWRTNRRKGEAQPPPRFLWLANRTLNEALEDNHCGACDGRSQLSIGGVVRQCPACNGAGKEYASGREWARWLDVDEKTFRSTWLPRVTWCRRELTIWEEDGIARVRACLS